MASIGYGLILFSLLLTACKPFSSSFRSSLNGSNESAILTQPKIQNRNAEVESVSKDWTPAAVELVCDLPGCPKALGGIFFAGPPVDGFVNLHRCSAFLTAADEVVTNGHCDYSDSMVGYFTTRTDIPEKTWRKIKSLKFKRFVQAPDDPERLVETLNPDVAVFQLEKEITDIPVLKLARGEPNEYSRLFGYGFDRVEQDRYVAKKFECTVRMHATQFPFALYEAPDLIQGFDCPTQEGNSGSPMFAKEGGEVEGILQGFAPPDEASAHSFKKHWSALLTNARCLDDAGPVAKPCLRVSQDEIDARWKSYYRQVIAEIYKKAPENAANLAYSYTTHAYELSVDFSKPARDFLLYYFPRCRLNDQAVSEVPMPVEIVELRFNEWANAVIVPVSLVSPPAAVKESWPAENKYKIGVQWPDAQRQVLPAKDENGAAILPLPSVMGSEFTVALERCPG